MMFKCFSFAVLFLLAIQEKAAALKVDLGLVLPVHYGINQTVSAGNWHGYILSGGVNGRIGIMDLPGTPLRFVFETFCLISFDQYFLPSDKFAPGTFINSWNLRYGGTFLVYLFQNFYEGIGFTMAYTFAGDYGTAALRNDFTTNMYGNKIYLSVVCGYDIEVFKDVLFVPLELKFNIDPFSSNSRVMEIGLEASVVYRFNFNWGATNGKPAETVKETVTKIPQRKFTAAEIQNYSVAEITAFARKAIADDDPDTAKLLVREGLLKEPDNQELLTLFGELVMKKR